jgi:NAD(P)-dependent dehydrogenase (short-subunit alcohol dehydrogenase family)
MTKTVLITGAAHRIGRAVALGLAEDGWKIAIHYSNSANAANELAQIITDKGGNAETLQANLGDAGEANNLISRVVETVGPLSALINNASVFERDEVTTLTDDSWDMHLNVNLKAPAILMRDFAKQAQAGGNIINIIDQRVWRLNPDFISYTVSKTGLWTLTQTFAQALAEQQIRVNGIGPGPTLANQRQNPEEFEKQTRLVPLGSGANPQDIIDGVRYILSAQAMTGQMIALDGGQHLAWKTPDVTEVVE